MACINNAGLYFLHFVITHGNPKVELIIPVILIMLDYAYQDNFLYFLKQKNTDFNSARGELKKEITAVVDWANHKQILFKRTIQEIDEALPKKEKKCTVM